MPNILTVKNLFIEKGEHMLFKQLSFEICSGDILQVRGINGSGKTSLLRTLAGIAYIQQGAVLWNKKSIKDHKESYYEDLIYIGHKYGIKHDLTALENIQFMHSQAKSHSKPSLRDITIKMGLEGKEQLLTRDLSAGQKKRVALARLLMLENPLWILDEPFSAIDSSGVELIHDLMLSHQSKGGLIIYTSHQDIVLKSDKKEIEL